MPSKVEKVGCTCVFYNFKGKGGFIYKAEMPRAAAVVWISTPVQRPDAVATPAFLPCEMLWVSTNRMSGPGRSVSAAEAAIK